MSDNVLKSAVEVAKRIEEDELRGCMVQEVDLSREGMPKARAVDVTFRRIALHEADLTRTTLSRSKFAECSCRGARFDNATIRGTSFFNCELIEARFANASISGSSFFNTRLGNADFSGTRIQSTTFNSCELFGARFPRALIIHSKFEAAERGNVTLDRANFSNAVLIDCDLAGANLFGADFTNALLIKVDLRHANITGAKFDGCRMIDVQVDLSPLEPGERQMIERAKFDDPWRNHGFMAEVLAPYTDEEMHRMLEYVLRTYIIEAGDTTAEADSFQALIQGMKARYDFEELELIRVRNGTIQVRHGLDWHDLGAAMVGSPSGGHAPAPAASGPASSDGGGGSSPRLRRPDVLEEAPKKKDNTPPKRVGTSKRFRKLEMD
ncbi:MAG: hypothetical protein ACI9MR_003242 [Myxococcota bacterium]|jgi:uncharacterized protein YjbI with pentapeptide repeats